MADELSTLGKVIATTIFGDVLFVHTEKGVYWWDEPRYRKLVSEKPGVPANEAALPIRRETFSAVIDPEPAGR